MRSYGSETHGLRREERALVAREFDSPVVYRRVLTPYEMQKAEADKFYYGGSIARNFGFPEGASWMDYHLMHKRNSSPSESTNQAAPNQAESTWHSLKPIVGFVLSVEVFYRVFEGHSFWLGLK